MTKKPKYQTPTGMHDVLPEDQKYFSRIYQVVGDIADFYGFQKINTCFNQCVNLKSHIVNNKNEPFNDLNCFQKF